MDFNVELIAYAVRRYIERDTHSKVSLTYPPSAKAMGQDASYVRQIIMTQRVSPPSAEEHLRNSIAANQASGQSKPIPTLVFHDRFYIYYRNKITRAGEEPALSSIEIGYFSGGAFNSVSKFHVDRMSSDKEIVQEIKDNINKLLGGDLHVETVHGS